MSVTHEKGPLVVSVFDGTVLCGGAAPTDNQDAGPSLIGYGFGIIDPRYGWRRGGGQAGAGNNANLGVGWLGTEMIECVNAAPSAISAVNISALGTPTVGTPLVLVSTTGAGITVLAAALTVLPSMTVIPSGTLAIDGAPGTVAFGTSGAVLLYDPTKALARNVRITTNADDTGGTYNVVGFDVYGYAQTENITGVNIGVAAGAKAWKFITSITPAGTINSTSVSVGTGDVYGLPIRADDWGHVRVTWNNNLITANTGFVAAVTTAATHTSGDVRGTYLLQSTSSDGTKTLQIFVLMKAGNIGSPLGLTGVIPA